LVEVARAVVAEYITLCYIIVRFITFVVGFEMLHKLNCVETERLHGCEQIGRPLYR